MVILYYVIQNGQIWLLLNFPEFTRFSPIQGPWALPIGPKALFGEAEPRLCFRRKQRWGDPISRFPTTHLISRPKASRANRK